MSKYWSSWIIVPKSEATGYESSAARPQVVECRKNPPDAIFPRPVIQQAPPLSLINTEQSGGSDISQLGRIWSLCWLCYKYLLQIPMVWYTGYRNAYAYTDK